MYAPIAITLTADNQLTPDVPAKAAKFAIRALSRGLITVQTDTHDGGSSYSITSPNPVDDWRLWIHFTAGHNGGRLNLVQYTPNPPKGRATTKKLTIMGANILIDDMGDSLDRHNAREAAKLEARRNDHAVDLNAVTHVHQTEVAVTEAPATAAEGAYRTASVTALKAAPAVDQNPDVRAEAQTVLGTLKANGRFAIRAAHRGTIPRNTPAKVRHALVRRGLASVAGGALTDLGRAVHALILN